MMTKKTMTILSVFMIVALTAVGFAAWLIVGTIDAETTGSFVSNELKDKYFKVEVEFDTTDSKENGKIVFGRPATAYNNSSDAWLSYSNKDAVEHLTSRATVKFIPDDGFLKNDTKPEENRDMKYYLEEVIENEDATSSTVQHRTVRVVIDILDVIGEGATHNYKWFDMAVELGYIQYPTAYVLERDAGGTIIADQTYATASHPLKWYTNESATVAEEELVTLDESANEFKKFEKGVLAIDLDADMFFVNYDGDGKAKEATVEIMIDFAWGKMMKLIESGKEVFANPYKYFSTVKPEDAVDVTKYLIESTGILGDTRPYPQKDEIAGIEGVENDDAATIRYKDLAQKMLDYLRDYLNYVPADAEADPVVQESGVRFSIILLEGKPDVA